MGSRSDLLRPFGYSLRNRFLRGGRMRPRIAGGGIFGLLLCLALYLVTVKVVRYFHGQNELGVIRA